MLKLRLSYLGHDMRRGRESLEKTVMLGKVEGNRRRGRPNNTRWTDSLKEPTGLRFQELSRAVEDRTVWRALVRRVSMSLKQLDST